MKYTILAVFVFAIAVLAFWPESGSTPPPAAERVVTQTIGWAELVSEPISILSLEGPEARDNIRLMEISFRMSDMTYTAIVNPLAMRGGISPLPATGNHWEKGDEVFIVSVPDGFGIQTKAYIVTDYRPKKQ